MRFDPTDRDTALAMVVCFALGIFCGISLLALVIWAGGK
jgi:hypothetical protein